MLESVGLTTEVEAVYVAMLQNPMWGVEDLAAALRISEESVRDALNAMADQALVQPREMASLELAAVSPHAALITLMAKAEADLISRQGQLDAARAAIASLTAIHDATRQRDEIIRLDGPKAARERRFELSMSMVSERLCLITNGADLSHEALAVEQELKEQAVARGVVLREVFPDSARHRPAMAAHTKWLAANGVPGRTVPDVPVSLLIADGSVALVPADPDDPDRGAIEIRSPGAVAALRLLFEQVWRSGTQFGQRQETGDGGLTPQERALLRLFEAGYTDEAAGRKLDLSARSVRRITAELTDRLGVSSRFQAGAEAVRQGWL
ncbi:helix-turn-helix transcriptional regulator [Actinoplanes sp. NPDC026623]|uniref:helix-turn-helix transcriptional regulator n=1 Tax=Actinoplanes sp. NPDC026623 TaxID=3155610 RepID=UPI0033CC0C29